MNTQKKDSRTWPYLLILLVLFLMETPSFAQTGREKPFMRFRNITDNLGLPGEWARCIFQDSRGLMWFGTDIGFKYFDGYSFKEYPLVNDDVIVTALTEDHLGNIWASASADALYHLDRKSDVVSRYQLVRDTLVKLNQVYPLLRFNTTLFEDSRQDLWVSTQEGILRFDVQRHTFSLVEKAHQNYGGLLYEDDNRVLWEVMENGIRRFNNTDSLFIPFLDQEGELQRIKGINSCIRDRSGHLWFTGLSGGLFHFDPVTKLLTRYVNDPNNPSGLSFDQVNHIMADRQNRIWVAADDGGLDLFDRATGGFFHYQPNFRSVEGFSNKPAFLYEDNTNGLWVSHYHAGISYYGNFTKKFIAYAAFDGDPKSLSSPYAVSFFERPNGDIWIGTDGGGLNLWKRKENEFLQFKHQPNNPNSLISNKIYKVIEDKQGYVWIRNRFGDIERFDSDIKNYKSYPLNGSLYCDKNGEVWLTSNGGIYTFNPEKDAFVLTIPDCHGILEDQSGNFWVSTTPNNLCKYNFETREIEECFSQHACAISVDSKNNFWMLLLEQGDTLVKYNPTTRVYSDTVVLVNSRDHLHNTIIIDKNDDVWLGTKDGLYRYQPSNKELKHFDYSDGVASNFLRFGLPIKTQRDELIFGSNKGFTIFHPDSIKENTFIPPVLITSFKIGNQEVPVTGTLADSLALKSPLQQYIHFADKVRLRHFQNDLTFEFAALDYTNPQKNQYKYTLEGYDNDWTITESSQRFARYTNLAPRNYIFRVEGTNSDGFWNGKGDFLFLTILPPWYWAWWSKTFYLLVISGILYAFYHFQLKRQLAVAEAAQLRELDYFKTRLYANITHEFRTPLTVIAGMTDQILEHPKEWFREGLVMIKRNSGQLLQLVNQLLDLSKLESDSLPVRMIRDDIIQYLKYLTESLHSYAESKDIRLHLLPDVKTMEMDFDPEKIQSIFINLLGNAIKFTPAGGDVYVAVSIVGNPPRGSSLVLKVKDNGIGIPEAQQPFIFDRFYQANNSSTRVGEGTGIGLSLTNELVKLLGGSIKVDSQEGEFTEFTVILPVSREAEKVGANGLAGENHVPAWKAQSLESLVVATPTLMADAGLPLALLIEDNRDVLKYLAACLQGQYRLEMATNGQEGIEKSIEQIPDIIISDVMMPEKDGFEVLATLKRDERTSHIPVVLLTAKADIESRLEGLERGADAYLAKPFEQRELEVVLRKLIALRQQLQARYSSLLPVTDANDKALPPENAFLTRLRQCIEQHMEDEDFGIHELCHELGVSRTQLHRKLTALTGKSTSQVIRGIRMQKAMKLLKDPSLNVSEVGYAVGYSNPSHFTQMFTEEFGASPSRFRGG